MPVGLDSDAFAAAAMARDESRLADTITDLFLPDEARLDDRLRLASRSLLASIVASVEADLRRHGARLLAGLGDERAMSALLEGDGAMPRLIRSGVLRDAQLMGELIAANRVTLLAERLPADDGDDERPSLLIRLAESEDPVVAATSRALLAGRSRATLTARDLPSRLRHLLVWWVAAALRPAGRADAGLDRALAGAAQRCLAAIDEGDRATSIASRLAAALDPTPAELPDLLVEALGDRQFGLFIALLARATGLDGETARAVVLDPEGDRLWSALRVLKLERAHIARIGWLLAEADPRRDLDAFADRLDTVAATDAAAAAAALNPLLLPSEFRRAIAAIGGDAA